MTEWKTEISDSGEDAVVRGKDLDEVMAMDFADAIWLTLTGKEPSEKESEIFNTIMSSSIDHGVGNPSTVSARTVQSGGNGMNTSVAAGVMALGDKHGGAIEEAMKLLQDDKTAEEIVEEYLESGDTIPGIGHKVYTDEDPRAVKILEKSQELGISGDGVEKMMKIRDVLSEKKVDLVLNVDGAISGVMTDLGWDYRLGKGIFIIARTPGLVAHVREEMGEEDFRREKGEYEGD